MREYIKFSIETVKGDSLTLQQEENICQILIEDEFKLHQEDATHLCEREKTNKQKQILKKKKRNFKCLKSINP